MQYTIAGLFFFCFFFVFFKVNTIIKLTEKYNIHRVIYCTCFSRVAHYSIDLPGIFVLSYDLVKIQAYQI